MSGFNNQTPERSIRRVQDRWESLALNVGFNFVFMLYFHRTQYLCKFDIHSSR